MAELLPFADTLTTLARTLASSGAEIMIVGATARDIALAHEGQDAARRATEDVDVAVAVNGHDSFAAVTANLKRIAGAQHKFEVNGVEVDVIPFGDIESDARTVSWADGFVVNTLGLAEAFRVALIVDLPAGQSIRVATLAAQSALKTFAWADRSSRTTRDGADLGTIIDAYSQGDRLDDVYATRNEGLLAHHGYDPRLVGAHLLGTEVQARMGTQVANAAAAIIGEDLGDQQKMPAALRLGHQDPEGLLAAYRDGLLDSRLTA